LFRGDIVLVVEHVGTTNFCEPDDRLRGFRFRFLSMLQSLQYLTIKDIFKQRNERMNGTVLHVVQQYSVHSAFPTALYSGDSQTAAITNHDYLPSVMIPHRTVVTFCLLGYKRELIALQVTSSERERGYERFETSLLAGVLDRRMGGPRVRQSAPPVVL